MLFGRVEGWEFLLLLGVIGLLIFHWNRFLFLFSKNFRLSTRAAALLKFRKQDREFLYTSQ